MDRYKFMQKDVLFLSLIVQPLSAISYENIITESFLQSTFNFKSGDTLKYAQCRKKSYPTCTYVWGKPSTEKQNAMAKKYGLAPKGQKLMVIYAQASSQNDFKRVLQTYNDAIAVEGFGREAVWSAKRRQLSFITKKNLIVHVNVDGVKSSDPLLKAKTVARQVMQGL